MDNFQSNNPNPLANQGQGSSNDVNFWNKSSDTGKAPPAFQDIYKPNSSATDIAATTSVSQPADNQYVQPSASPALNISPSEGNYKVPADMPAEPFIGAVQATPVDTNSAPTADTVSQPFKNALFDDDEEIINKDILELLGTSDLSEDEKADFYQKMIDTIENRVIGRIADQLTEEEQQEWNKIGESKDKQKMDEFLKAKNIDINQLTLQETLSYKAEIAVLAQPIKDAAQKAKSQSQTLQR